MNLVSRKDLDCAKKSLIFTNYGLRLDEDMRYWNYARGGGGEHLFERGSWPGAAIRDKQLREMLKWFGMIRPLETVWIVSVTAATNFSGREQKVPAYSFELADPLGRCFSTVCVFETSVSKPTLFFSAFVGKAAMSWIYYTVGEHAP